MDYTPHQRRIIERYYDRRDEIMLAKLGDIVSDLYLAENEAARNRLWQRANKAMDALKVPAGIVSHILEKRDPEVLARNLKGWLEAASKSSK